MAVTRATGRRKGMRRSGYKSRRTTVSRKRQPWTKKRPASGSLMRIPRGVTTPFPTTRIVRHRYVETVEVPVAAAAGFTQLYNFRANSTFDPNLTGTGHQPLYRDQMAAEYLYYTVLASYIRVTFLPSSTAWAHSGVLLTVDGAIPTDTNTLMESERFVVPKIDSQDFYPTVRRASFDAKRVFKMSYSQLMGNSDYKILAGSNPVSDGVRFFTIYRAPADPTVTLPAVKVLVELIQVTAWRDPEDAIGS